jgi:phage shock protein PspC (stress-responsive transcriptional regulator)
MSKIFGVAAGIAEYLNIDPTIVRMLFVLLVLAGGSGVLLYLILAIIMPPPEAPFYGNQSTQDTSYVEVDSNGNAVRNEPQAENNSNTATSDSVTTSKVIATAVGLACICIGGILLTRQFLSHVTIKIIIAVILIAVGVALTAISLKKR